jgi:hypothetical protein
VWAKEQLLSDLTSIYRDIGEEEVDHKDGGNIDSEWI